MLFFVFIAVDHSQLQILHKVMERPRARYAEERAVPRRAGPSYAESLVGRWKTRPPPVNVKWPSLWGFLFAVVVQMLFGLFPTLLCFLALVAADERRYPWAVGAKPIRPFLAWLLGAIIGISGCQVMIEAKRSADSDWVFWGAMAELYRWQKLRDAGLRRSLTQMLFGTR